MSNEKRFFLSLFFLVKTLPLLYSQTYYSPVFPNLQGQELLDSVVQKYKSFALLPYSTCRDTLFSKIDAQNDSLECIYTGMKRYLPPGVDPTDAVLLNGQPNGINTEHAYPQSKGASGYGRSDMHILYPARVKTNTVRSNNPFKEIPDFETTTWFFNTNEMSSPPTSNRDAYSESTSTVFEPRESKKGDLARSIFYFYSMYYFEASQADPDFFSIQQKDLCAWHFEDPVDSLEWVRSFDISAYQGNLNPFVLDCSLAFRTYCDFISSSCEVLTSTSSASPNFESSNLFPNPGLGDFKIKHPFGPGHYNLEIRSGCGKLMQTFHGFSDMDTIEISFDNARQGLYFIVFLHEKAQASELFKYFIMPE